MGIVKSLFTNGVDIKVFGVVAKTEERKGGLGDRGLELAMALSF